MAFWHKGSTSAPSSNNLPPTTSWEHAKLTSSEKVHNPETSLPASGLAESSNPKSTLKEEIQIAKEKALQKSLVPSSNSPQYSPAAVQKKEPNRKRNQRICVRMTPGEYRAILSQIKESGKTQQAYLLSKIQQDSNESSDFQDLSEIGILLNDVIEKMRLLVSSPWLEENAQVRLQFLQLLKSLTIVRKLFESFLIR